ncbi:hypothetical protein MPER_13625, partial [Moniliophthora perniciosa FA553]
MNGQEPDSNSGEEPQERYYDAQRFTFNVPSANERRASRTSSYDEPYDGSYTYYPAQLDSSQASYNSVPSSTLGAQQRPQFNASQSYTDSQGSTSRPQSGVFDLSVYDTTSGGSLSAPSHKLGFDHGSLYPPGVPYGSGSES